MHHKKVLVFYDHFYPAWKAGGPVQSIGNLVRQLSDTYQFFIVCKPHEMGERTPLAEIEVNEWNNWEGIASVYYKSYGSGSRQSVSSLIQAVAPDVIFINGLFSLYFNLAPLHAALQYNRKLRNVKIILSARGMLHPGALSQKPFKKQLFLEFFRLMGWHRRVFWHATDQQEWQHIQHVFGTVTKGGVAGNFPNLLPAASYPHKQPGQLIMASVALVSAMKNHLLVLQALQQVKANVEWHIYGPVKDTSYWQQCQAAMQQLPGNVKVEYKGPLEPNRLQQVMPTFHLFVLPSKSENFGHSILEALSAGKPVLTTTTTPFSAVNEAGAGQALAPDTLVATLPAAIENFAAMDAAAWQLTSSKASAFAAGFVDLPLLQQQYAQLFETL